MIELGLSRTHRLLAQTPLPWRAIHVAGTNGKGSICAYISAMLEVYNGSALRRYLGHERLRHGRFTSPHLVDRWDCITLDGATVPKTMFDEVESNVLKRNKDLSINASEFELLTATAFEIFTKATVDIGVVEVGMGGRLDSTNILGQTSEHDSKECNDHFGSSFRPPPLITAISSIGLDHQAFLGNTLAEIACEKAGIIKNSVDVFAATGDASVEEAISQQAERANASRLVWISAETTLMDICTSHGSWPCTEIDDDIIEQLNKPVQSRWANGAIALQSVFWALAYMERFSHQSKEPMSSFRLVTQTFLDLARVPDRIEWPGRLQPISLQSLNGFKPDVLLDGAHNIQSAKVLAEFARGKADGRPIHWILAASQGKDISEILKTLLETGDTVSAVEFGSVDGMPWVKPQPSSEIVIQATSVCLGNHSHHGGNIEAALRHATKTAETEHQYVVIAGSLYLVGDVVRLLRQSM